MKINFSWRIQFDRLEPFCSFDSVNGDDMNLLSCLLIDDGGVAYFDTISWVNEGIKRINAVLMSESRSLDWDRERWGVVFTLHNAQIYSLLDDSYFQNITTQQLKSALCAWKVFLESAPDIHKSIEIEL